MSKEYIIQIIEAPTEAWAEAEDLLECFHKNNPFWAKEGLPLETEEEERQVIIDLMSDELPNGYSVVGDTISIEDGYKNYPDDFMCYIQDLLNDPKEEDYRKRFPLSWFKRSICGIHGLLIWYEETLYTLTEFLFYLAGFEVDKLQNPGKLFIGSIYQYCY